MKPKLFGSAIFLVSFIAAHAQVTVTVIGTANSTALGYTSGQSATFTYTLTNSFSNNANSYFDSTYNEWFEYHLTADQLFTSVTGTGLTGSFTRPTANDTDPHSYVETRKDYPTAGVTFLQMSAASQQHDMGITVSGADVISIYFQFYGSGTAFASGAYDQPAAVFSATTGIFSPSQASGLTVSTSGSGSISFNISSMTISTSAIPEPSTYAALCGLAILGFAA